MKKKRILILAAVIVLAVCGVVAAFWLLKDKAVAVDYTEMPADLLAAAKGHSGIDKDFATDDFSMVYNNADGTKTMYVYTHPIRYLGEDSKYRIIDNTIVPTQTGWQNKANDIKTVFEQDKLTLSLREHAVQLTLPQKEATLGAVKTLLGNRQEALQYAGAGYTLSCYPTYLGVKLQLDVTKPITQTLQFGLRADGLDINTDNAFYMDFQDESYVTAALLYQPTAKDAVGKTLRLRNALQYDGENLRLDLSSLAEVQYPVSIEFTLNMYKKKQADSCVMSGYPNSNQYLDNYLHVGRFDDLGNTESLLRFESSLYKTVAAEKVIPRDKGTPRNGQYIRNAQIHSPTRNADGSDSRGLSGISKSIPTRTVFEAGSSSNQTQPVRFANEWGRSCGDSCGYFGECRERGGTAPHG